MLHWAGEEPQELRLEQIGESYARYRLHVPEAEHVMMRSLESYGQISPVVVCIQEGRYELIDGFKRLGAARKMGTLQSLVARRIETDERGAKAAIYGLNRAGGRTREIEEAWIVHALVREDGLTQVEVAELLGRHKSWVCRRLAVSEKLGPEARADLQVGLLTPTSCGCPRATKRRFWIWSAGNPSRRWNSPGSWISGWNPQAAFPSNTSFNIHVKRWRKPKAWNCPRATRG